MACTFTKSFSKGDGGVLFLLCSFAGDNAGTIVFADAASAVNENFTVTLLETDDWDADFSPWEGTMPDSNRHFSGAGPVTLSLIQAYLTGNNCAVKYDKIIIAGYSLAGLFALWSVYESDLFDGCICCSGSLWFEKVTEGRFFCHIKWL